ncbi:hypothetical protein M0802_004654 [Mischocyttarus mexicanus]|nr:hypothetical protein M0802_004654 [Mischocyttarus mexicanus]
MVRKGVFVRIPLDFLRFLENLASEQMLHVHRIWQGHATSTASGLSPALLAAKGVRLSEKTCKKEERLKRNQKRKNTNKNLK